MLTNQYFIAVGVPFILLLLGSISRKLVHGHAWKRSDFYLGIDLSLAGISSGLIYISELLTTKASEAGCFTPACIAFREAADHRLLADAGFIVIALIGFLLVLALHQDQERNTSNPKGQLIFLGILSNLVGAGMLASFILFVKGVTP
ncbi:MAG: hypothetical protein ACJ8GN_02195 [Longimicrobiaceae bacterium]